MSAKDVNFFKKLIASIDKDIEVKQMTKNDLSY